MSRYDRPSHQVYMYFFKRGSWEVQFLEADLKTPLPRKLTFTDPKGVKGVDRRDVYGFFSTTPLSASKNYSVNIPSVNAFRLSTPFVNAFLSTPFLKLRGLGGKRPVWAFFSESSCRWISDLGAATSLRIKLVNRSSSPLDVPDAFGEFSVAFKGAMLLDRSVAPMSALTQSLMGPKQYFWMFPSQVRRAFMAFIATAVDESADREQRHTFAVAGLCWRHDKWVDLERHWNRYLKKHGIEYFKTSEYLSLNGQFLRFRDKSDYPAPLGRQAAKEIFDDLAQIIRISRGKGIGLVIDLKSWRTIRKSSTAREVFPFKDPYLFAHSALIVYVGGRADRHR